MSRKSSKTASRPALRATARKAAKVAAKRPTTLPADDVPVRIARALEAIAAHLSASAPMPDAAQSFAHADAFVWHPDGRLSEVKRVSRVDLFLLKGIDRMRDILIENTERFASGLPANNALLWGARGMGKSSLVKAAHATINLERKPAAGCAAPTAACAAFTSDDLPMPRAPQSSALFAGRPRVKRSVFSTKRSRTRSMPLRSDISTRLTRATGASRRPSGCQTKASALTKSGTAGGGGARRSKASAIRSSTSSVAGVSGPGLALDILSGALER